MIVTSLKSLIITLFLLVSTNHAMEVPTKTRYTELNTHLTPSHTPNMPIIPEILDNILNHLDETDHLIDRIQFLSTCKGFYNHGWKLIHKKYPHMDTLVWHTLHFPTVHERYHFNYLLTVAMDYMQETWNWTQQLTMKMFLQKNSINVCCERLSDWMTDEENPECGRMLLEAWGYEKAMQHYRTILEESAVLDDILEKYESKLEESGKLFKGLLKRAQPEQGYFYNWTGLGWFKSKEDGFLAHLFGLFEEFNRENIALWDIIKAELHQGDAFDVLLKPDIKSCINTVVSIFALFEQHTRNEDNDKWGAFPKLRDDFIYPKYPEEISLSTALYAGHVTRDELYFKGDDKKENDYMIVIHPLRIFTDINNVLASEVSSREFEELSPHFKSILLSKAKVIQK